MTNLSRPSVSYFSPIPDYENQVSEFESFISKLSSNNETLEDFHLLWKSINQFAVRAVRLEKKWKGTKKATGISPIAMMRKDLNYLMYKLNLSTSSKASATEWGMLSTQRLLDILPNELPYLQDTNYYGYLSEIGELLDELSGQDRHSSIMRILREFKDHRDTTVIGQFSSNEMVKHFKSLNETKFLSDRQAIVNVIGIYGNLCGIWEKDMILANCLLQEKQNIFKSSYKELREKATAPNDKKSLIDYVGTHIHSFMQPYRRSLRNADAHNDIETDDPKGIVIVLGGKNKPNEHYSYVEVLEVTKEMSALVSAFRLLVVVLANNDWKWLHKILSPK